MPHRLSADVWFRRVSRDLKDLIEDASGTFIVSDYQDDGSSIEVAVKGPEDSPYKDGTFEVVISLTRSYPQRPPRARFSTLIFHPNISSAGTICVDFLEDNQWSSGTTLLMVVEALRSLLALPNEMSPLNVDAGSMLSCSRETFEATASAFAHVFAGAPDNIPAEMKNKMQDLMNRTGWTRERALIKLSRHNWVVDHCYRNTSRGQDMQE